MFVRKIALIEKHLYDQTHPLTQLQKTFSEEVRDYYELFLEVNLNSKNGNF